ncbi:MAG TPA: hypothetical protein VF815_17830 [Myxococcaceae bacterium]|jgi:hypothetical protein
MKRANASGPLRRFLLLRSQALVAFVCGLLGFSGCASSPPRDTLTDRFTQACAALDAGDLDGAAQQLRALREEKPGLPELRVLESLLTLRRERPALDWLEAFLQAWNHAGRPDLRDSTLLPATFTAEPPAKGANAARMGASEQQEDPLRVLARDPDEARGRLLLQHLKELNPPELLFAADSFFKHPSVPAELRASAAQALRARLSELTLSSPRAMQYPAQLLMDGTSPEAPFTSEELQALETIASLPDWRETDFHVLFQHALNRLQAAGYPEPTYAAFSVAVASLATEPAFLLYKRTEASRAVLSRQQLHQLGEALWRIGSRMAEESTLLERLVAGRMMVDGAQLVEDEERAQQASALQDEARAAADAMRQAAPDRWPLQALNTALTDAHTRDELGFMFRFLPPGPDSYGVP